MADTPDTPTDTADKPADTPRRRGPRKQADSRGSAPTPTSTDKPVRRARTAKVVTEAAAAPVAAAKGAAKAAKPVKPRSSKRGVGRPAGSGKKAPAAAAVRAGAAKATGKVGGKWGAAAIVGSLAAAGAAAAALLSLRGSTPKIKHEDEGIKPAKGAHQPDGSDSSKEFAAGIADENTIPD